MFAHSEKQGPYGAPKPTTRSQKFSRLLGFLLLCSTAATLLTVAPTQWSFFHPSSKVTRRVAEWQDNIWPLRPPTPWDISTDYSYPREVKYNVQEGTWLRLDVHPITGDIVFDMVGDIYCIPGKDTRIPPEQPVKALPILNGVPYDSDPHFSPNGDRLVFRSDAELGVENIWVLEWKGCEEMNIRPQQPTSEALLVALQNQAYDNQLLVDGVREDSIRKNNRLLREGRLSGMWFLYYIAVLLNNVIL